MSDEENKPINLKDIKHAARDKRDRTYKQTEDALWQNLCEVWDAHASGVAKLPRVPGDLYRSDNPDAVFSVLLENLISLAQAQQVDNEDILEIMVSLASADCEPKGRVEELLDRAFNVLHYGDEEAMEKAARELHAQGKITDEELRDMLPGR
jgi:hypothetical protein